MDCRLKVGEVVATSFERGSRWHHHSGRVARDMGLIPGSRRISEYEVRLFRPMHDAEPNTASQSIVLFRDEIRRA